MDAEDHYAVGEMRCVVLPSLEEGLVVGTFPRVVEPFSDNPAPCLRIVSVSIVAVHIPETGGCAGGICNDLHFIDWLREQVVDGNQGKGCSAQSLQRRGH